MLPLDASPRFDQADPPSKIPRTRSWTDFVFSNFNKSTEDDNNQHQPPGMTFGCCTTRRPMSSLLINHAGSPMRRSDSSNQIIDSPASFSRWSAAVAAKQASKIPSPEVALESWWERANTPEASAALALNEWWSQLDDAPNATPAATQKAETLSSLGSPVIRLDNDGVALELPRLSLGSSSMASSNSDVIERTPSVADSNVYVASSPSTPSASTSSTVRRRVSFESPTARKLTNAQASSASFPRVGRPYASAATTPPPAIPYPVPAPPRSTPVTEWLDQAADFMDQSLAYPVEEQENLDEQLPAGDETLQASKTKLNRTVSFGHVVDESNAKVQRTVSFGQVAKAAPSREPSSKEEAWQWVAAQRAKVLREQEEAERRGTERDRRDGHDEKSEQLAAQLRKAEAMQREAENDLRKAEYELLVRSVAPKTTGAGTGIRTGTSGGSFPVFSPTSEGVWSATAQPDSSQSPTATTPSPAISERLARIRSARLRSDGSINPAYTGADAVPKAVPPPTSAPSKPETQVLWETFEKTLDPHVSSVRIEELRAEFYRIVNYQVGTDKETEDPHVPPLPGLLTPSRRASVATTSPNMKPTVRMAPTPMQLAAAQDMARLQQFAFLHSPAAAAASKAVGLDSPPDNHQRQRQMKWLLGSLEQVAMPSPQGGAAQAAPSLPTALDDSDRPGATPRKPDVPEGSAERRSLLARAAAPLAKASSWPHLIVRSMPRPWGKRKEKRAAASAMQPIIPYGTIIRSASDTSLQTVTPTPKLERTISFGQEMRV